MWNMWEYNFSFNMEHFPFTVTKYRLYLGHHDLMHHRMQTWQLQGPDLQGPVQKYVPLQHAPAVDNTGLNYLRISWNTAQSDPRSLHQSFIPTSMVAGSLKQLLKEERKHKEGQKGEKGMAALCPDLQFRTNAAVTCRAFQNNSYKSVKGW